MMARMEIVCKQFMFSKFGLNSIEILLLLQYPVGTF